jgi:hypothetical protein
MNNRKVVSASVLMVLWAVCGAALGADAALIKARQKVFNVENVDAATGNVKKDRVIVSWMTNTTYAVSVLGRVILLDAYVTRLEVKPGRTPFVIQDMVDLKPEAILLGHGHFDHADNAAYIAKKTGATIYGAPEHCDQMQADVTRMFNDPNAINGGAKIISDSNPVNCVALVDRGSTPGAQIARIPQLEPLACVVAFKHMHSNAVPPDPAYPPFAFNVNVDPRDPQMYPLGTSLTPPANLANAQPGQINTRTSSAGSLSVGGPISILYQFVLRGGYNFTFLWHNTTGALKEGIAPDGNWGPAIGQNLFNLFDSLPLTDVEIGSASSANTANNGHRDLVFYVQHLKPQIFIPGHMTTGTNGVGESSSQELFYMYRNAFANVSTVQPTYQPEVRWLVDPIDYLRPLVYIPGDPRWFNAAKPARVSQYCS